MKEKWKWFVELLSRLGKTLAKTRGTPIPDSDDTKLIWDDGAPHPEYYKDQPR